MSSILTIPAQVVPRLREGTYTCVHDLADLMVDGSRRANRDDDPSVLVKVRGQLDGTWRLLDAIGWRHAEVEVGAEHTDTILAAVEQMLPMLAEWLADDPGKPGREQEHRALGEFADTLRANKGQEQ